VYHSAYEWELCGRIPANSSSSADATQWQGEYFRSGDAMTGWLLPLHVSLVGLSLLLFVWRGLRLWFGSPLTGRSLHRTLPDTVDTLLLASGILLAYALGVAPWQDAWLAAKLIAIVLYILLGFVSFSFRGALWVSHLCFIFALMTVVYIVAVAHTMQPWPWAS